MFGSDGHQTMDLAPFPVLSSFGRFGRFVFAALMPSNLRLYGTPLPIRPGFGQSHLGEAQARAQ